MTPLAPLLQARIQASGPITLSDYMTECLAHPTHGYYTTRDPLGATGDFTTAPEISQMFGELLGLALAQAWMDQGTPDPFYLVEPGPGRGTLMADILRATQQVPGFHAAAQLHLIETSPVLRQRQTETLPVAPIHHDRFDTLPDAHPLFLVANEFFDALPIRQFIRDGRGWREVVVGLARDGTLTPGLSDPMGPNTIAHRLDDTQDGDIVEVCPMGQTIAQDIGRRIAVQGGAALIVDYGNWRSSGDTFQALEAHRMVSPFARPGMADLTAHVDFEALAQAAQPAAHSELIPQGIFLERLGITQRAQSLAKNLSGAALDSHIAAHRRLTHAREMGTLFKVMALYPEDAALPPGFDP